MKNDTCVYLHKRLDTNEVFYVGIGNDYRPYVKNKRSKWWNRIVNKAGYEVEVIENGLTWKSACLIEIALIEFFGRRDLGKGNLVNLTDGGEGAKGCFPSEETKAKIGVGNKGKKVSAETKANMSKAQKGRKFTAEHKAKLSAALKGKKHTAEARAKMSEALKGKKKSAEHKAKMSEALKGNKRNAKLTDEIVTEIIYQLKFHYYIGMLRDLAKQYGVNPDTISNIKTNKNWKHIDRNLIIKKT